MATGNINKIVNSRLKPFVISKNTTDIINSCISKIYRNPKTKNALNEMQQAKQTQQNNSSKLENQGPIRALRTKGGANLHAGVALPNIAQVNSKTKDALLTKMLKSNNKKKTVLSAMGTVAKPEKKTAKKLKSPNVKLYTRRYDSAASSASSAASIFSRMRNDEHRQHKVRWSPKPEVSIRTFNTGKYGTNHKFGLGSVTRYLVPARKQHMASLDIMPENEKIEKIETSADSTSHYDLMMIDRSLKDRISLRRQNFAKVLETIATESKSTNPLYGWNHPPNPRAFVARMKKRNIQNAELLEQNRHLRTLNREKQFEKYGKVDLMNTDYFSLKRNNRKNISEIFADESPMSVNTPAKATLKKKLPILRTFNAGAQRNGRTNKNIMSKPIISKPTNDKGIIARKPAPTNETKQRIATEPSAVAVLAAVTAKLPTSSYNASRYNRFNYLATKKY